MNRLTEFAPQNSLREIENVAMCATTVTEEGSFGGIDVERGRSLGVKRA
jgi:hypothetical protein